LCHIELAGPYFVCVVLYPTTLWVVLSKFFLRDTEDFSRVVKNDGAGTRGALIESEDSAHGAGFLEK
jgi:hypothetical protein